MLSKNFEIDVLEMWLNNPCPANLNPSNPKNIINILFEKAIIKDDNINNNAEYSEYFLRSVWSINFPTYAKIKELPTVATAYNPPK